MTTTQLLDMTTAANVSATFLEQVKKVGYNGNVKQLLEVSYEDTVYILERFFSPNIVEQYESKGKLSILASILIFLEDVVGSWHEGHTASDLVLMNDLVEKFCSK